MLDEWYYYYCSIFILESQLKFSKKDYVNSNEMVSATELRLWRMPNHSGNKPKMEILDL